MTEGNADLVARSEQLRQEFKHLRLEWCWLLIYGVLLVVCGIAAIIYPAVTSFATVVVLGIMLMVAGISTIIAAFWTGKWSGVLVQLLVGILYVVVGYMITDRPLQSAAALMLFMASFFIVIGMFRTIAALVIRYPYSGWSLLNGMVTLLLGVIVYRLYHQFPPNVIWVLGTLVGVEMVFHGWTWIALSLAVRRIPKEVFSNPTA